MTAKEREGLAGWGILLINLGTPETPRPDAVRRFLREFLSDPSVIDLPALPRALLLHLFILPFRPYRSSAAYLKIWTQGGSPLLVHSRSLAEKVATAFREEKGFPVELGMRYQKPSIRSALERLQAAGCDRIVVLPLFPQFSSASWGSAVQQAQVEASRLYAAPRLEIVPPFYDHPGFLDAFAELARPHLAEFRAEKVLMSFHGLPVRQIRKGDPSRSHCLQKSDCCERIQNENRDCYRAQCFATARGIAERLGLAPTSYQICFQSRLGWVPWIRPYTDLLIREFARSGVKRIAVLCPAFVADCLETLEEIQIRAREDFLKHGGEDLLLVPSLNSSELWVRTVIDLVQRQLRAEPEAQTRSLFAGDRE